MGVIPEKMNAPENVASAMILGHSYEVKNGQVKVAVQEHVDVLRRHGFTDAFEDAKASIDDMDREELVTFIEERGGDADRSDKLKALRKQAHAIANA